MVLVRVLELGLMKQLMQGHCLLVGQILRWHVLVHPTPHLRNQTPCIGLSSHTVHAPGGPGKSRCKPWHAAFRRHYAQDSHSCCDCHVSACLFRVLRRAPAKSLEMQEKSLYRKCCRDLALVVAARRLMSSRSTDAGWCFTSYTVVPTHAELATRPPMERTA